VGHKLQGAYEKFKTSSEIVSCQGEEQGWEIIGGKGAGNFYFSGNHKILSQKLTIVNLISVSSFDKS
jgi:hypothetical protein